MKGVGPRRFDETREDYIARCRTYIALHINPALPGKAWAFRVLERHEKGERIADIAVKWAREVVEEETQLETPGDMARRDVVL